MNGTIEFNYYGVSLRYNSDSGKCWRKIESKGWKLITPGTEKGYTCFSAKGRNLKLHRVVAEVFINGGNPLTPQQDVDHIKQADGSHAQDSLSNLRICSRSQNLMNQRIACNNKSGYKGVSLHKPANKWTATISSCGRRKHLGYFTTPEAAALAYNVAASNYFGEFAFLNPIPS